MALILIARPFESGNVFSKLSAGRKGECRCDAMVHTISWIQPPGQWSGYHYPELTFEDFTTALRKYPIVSQGIWVRVIFPPEKSEIDSMLHSGHGNSSRTTGVNIIDKTPR